MRADHSHSISHIQIDPALLAKRAEEQQVLDQLKTQKLPGQIKSKWALTYKLKMEQAILDAMKYETVETSRANTKNLFKGLETKTNAGNWLRDRQWQHKANPAL